MQMQNLSMAGGMQPSVQRDTQRVVWEGYHRPSPALWWQVFECTAKTPKIFMQCLTQMGAYNWRNFVAILLLLQYFTLPALSWRSSCGVTWLRVVRVALSK